MECPEVRTLFQDKKFKLVLYTSKILFPNFHSYCLPLYIFVNFYNIKQQKRQYFLGKTDSVCIDYLDQKSKENIDVNYSIVVNNKFTKNRLNGIMTVQYENKVVERYVRIIHDERLVSKKQAKLNCTLMFNIKNLLQVNNVTNTDIILSVNLRSLPPAKIKLIEEVELALISCPNDVDNGLIDSTLKSYFSKPKLLHKDDVIQVPLGKNSNLYYPSKAWNSSSTLYFKCMRIVSDHESEIQGGYVVIGETTVKQIANIQSFIPAHVENEKSLLFSSHRLCANEKIYPYGLMNYVQEIQKCMSPFFLKSLKMYPAFLITGRKGSGKEILISTIAAKFGMHFYKITMFDLTGHVHAQNETKLKNVVFNAKLFAPCLVYLKNFENFGKNNEGQFDERILANFTHELRNLFENNENPVILFCSSNEEKISGRLKREFLEIFTMKAFTEYEIMKNLEWLFEINNLVYYGNVQELAQKVNTFSLKDLASLVKRAKIMNSDEKNRNLLTVQSVSLTLDYMQTNFKETIGVPKIPKVQWDDIGGLTDVKEEIEKTISFPLRHSKLLSLTGLRRSGILLFGLPGTGKTLLAKAVATEYNLCFLSVKGPELLNMYIGQSEENIREVFERARASSPCIIFFDELDSLAPNRGASGDSGGVMDRVVSQLLAEMDGLNEEATVFVIGATNRPDLIDPALLRPGRFDKLLYVGPCSDPQSRFSTLKALTRRFNLSEKINLMDVIELCPQNITGADFYGLCANSWSNAVERLIQKIENGSLDVNSLTGNDVIVELEDFIRASSTLSSSISPDDLKYFEKLKNDLSSNK